MLAFVALGFVKAIEFSNAKYLGIGKTESRIGPITLTLVGEREILIRDKQRVDIFIERDGPRLVDVDLALRLSSN